MPAGAHREGNTEAPPARAQEGPGRAQRRPRRLLRADRRAARAQHRRLEDRELRRRRRCARCSPDIAHPGKSPPAMTSVGSPAAVRAVHDRLRRSRARRRRMHAHRPCSPMSRRSASRPAPQALVPDFRRINPANGLRNLLGPNLVLRVRSRRSPRLASSAPLPSLALLPGLTDTRRRGRHLHPERSPCCSAQRALSDRSSTPPSRIC